MPPKILRLSFVSGLCAGIPTGADRQGRIDGQGEAGAASGLEAVADGDGDIQRRGDHSGGRAAEQAGAGEGQPGRQPRSREGIACTGTTGRSQLRAEFVSHRGHRQRGGADRQGRIDRQCVTMIGRSCITVADVDGEVQRRTGSRGWGAAQQPSAW